MTINLSKNERDMLVTLCINDAIKNANRARDSELCEQRVLQFQIRDRQFSHLAGKLAGAA